MQHLTRTQVGRFEIQNAMKLSEIEEKVQTKTIDEVIVSVEDMFESLPESLHAGDL